MNKRRQGNHSSVVNDIENILFHSCLHSIYIFSTICNVHLFTATE